jgi:predicted membrane metal-binding protein
MPARSICHLVIRCIVAACALAWCHLAHAAGKDCIAVFDFELVDASLEGEINGIKADEQDRLRLLSSQLRDWINTGGGQGTCDMAPVQAEAHAANLSACGCISRLAQAVGGDLAIVSSVHKVSNLILNIRIDVFDARSNQLLAQLNADIRSNSDSSWKRGLKWLIDHRLAGALAAIQASRS